MKTAAVVAILATVGFQETDYKVEVAQKRIAAAMKEIRELQKKVAADPKLADDAEISKRQKTLQDKLKEFAVEIVGKDEKKIESFVLESLARFAPDVLTEMKRELMETNAMSHLRVASLALLKFQSQDSDGNGVKDFWVADVSGLQRLIVSGKPLKLYRGDEIALADAKPALPLDKEEEFVSADGSIFKFGKLGDHKPLKGYVFAVVPSYTDASGKQVKFDSGNGRNKDRFALCAYPAEYGKPCKMTFVVDATGAVLGKDNGGSAVTVLPADLGKDGWK